MVMMLLYCYVNPFLVFICTYVPVGIVRTYEYSYPHCMCCGTYVVAVMCGFARPYALWVSGLMYQCIIMVFLSFNEGKIVMALSLERQIFTDSHAKSILTTMNNLRKENTLCDVQLRVENKNFPAHRIVLAACSDYFCAMFTHGVSTSSFRKTLHVLNFRY